MFEKLRKLLVVNQADSEYISLLLASLLRGVKVAAWIITFVLLGYVLTGALVEGSEYWLFFGPFMLISAYTLQQLNKRGYVNWTVHLFLIAVTLVATSLEPLGFSVPGISILAYSIPVVVSGILLPAGASWIWTGVVLVAVVFQTLFSRVDYQLGIGLVLLAKFALLSAVTWLTRVLGAAVRQTLLRLRQLVQQTQASIEIGHTITSSLAVSSIIRQVVQSVYEAFDLYHVAMFVVDSNETTASLVDAAGAQADGLLERGVHVSLKGTTAVAAAINYGRRWSLARWKESVDPEGRTVQFTYERLPTRAELVIPLQVGDRILGALDIHSTELDPFQEEDIHTLAGLVGNVANALNSARLIGDLQNSYKELEVVHEQTERRSRYLEITAEVARSVTALLDPQDLLNKTVRLIHDGLSLYHVGVFLLDDEREWAILAAASSEGGQSLIERGHRLRVGREGIVGWVTQTGRPRVALDVSGDTTYSNTPYLSATRSEIVLPLLIGEEVVGALDVRSEREGDFSDEDMAILQILADQVAIALENARLFEKTQRALDEVQALQRYYVSREWEQLTEDHQAMRAEFLGLGVPPMETDWSPEMQMAIDQEGPVAFSDLDSVARSGDGGGQNSPPAVSALAVPIKLRDKVIGVLDLQETSETRHWTEEEISMTTAVADQLALALENARLFEETRTRAEELAVLNDLAQTLTARFTVSEVVEEAYRGMDRLINTRNFYIALYNAETDEVTFAFDVTEGNVARNFETRKAGRGLTEYIISSRTPLLIRENLPERMEELGIDAIGRTAQSWLGVPLMLGGQVLGVMAVQNYVTPRAYGEHERDLMMAVASQTAIAMRSAELFEETQRRAEELAVLNELARALTATLDRDEILRKSYEGASRLLRTPNFFVGLYDPERHMIDFVFDTTEAEEDVRLTSMSADEGLSGYVVRTGESLMVQGDVQAIHHQLGVPIIGAPSLSWLGVPMLIGSRVLGMMACQTFTEANAFDERDKDLLSAVASQTAIALQNAQLFGEAQRRATQLTAAADVARDATAILDVDQLLEETAHLISERFGFYHAGVFLLDDLEEYAVLRAVSSEGGRQMLEKGHKLRIGEVGIVGYVAGAGEPRVVADVELDPTHFKNPFLPKTRSEMALPLKVRGRVIGVLDVQSDQPAAFREDDVSVLQTMADQLAAAIANARLFQEVRTDSMRRALINEMLQTAAASQDPHELLHYAGEVISLRLETPSALFLMESREDNLLRTVAVHDAQASDVPVPTAYRAVSHEVNPILFTAVEGRQTSVLETRSDVVDPLVATARQAGGKSVIYVPLVSRDRILGVLGVGQLEDRSLVDVGFIELVAANLSVALENARLFQEAVHTAERLAEVDKLKMQFLANMSHELRTPLNSIIGFSRVILKGIDGPLTDMQRTDLQAVYDSGQHLLGLINDILEISKIEADKQELVLETVDLNDIISGVMAVSKALIKDKGVELQQSIPETLPLIIGDTKRIRQALLNLVSNAAKFTEDGYIRVEAAVSDVEVTISVADTGVGISPEKIEMIFEPFTQADASTTRRAGGTGLGLSISSAYVEMHGGRMWVESEIGVGSTFYFTLPIEGPSSEPELPKIEEQPEPEPEPASDKKVVMCVEDDEGVIMLFRRYLSKRGYDVIGMTDSNQVVERARELKPFAITLDVMMPDKDGWQVIRELKADPETRDIPVVMCTIISDKDQGLSLGAADYLVKPILEQDLLAALDRLDRETGHHLVLIVDDQADDRSLIRRMLESQEGYEILEASGGQEAIALIKWRRPHIIILDLMMPDVDGFAVLEAVKADASTRTIPIVVVTAKELTEEERSALNHGVEDLLQKGLFEQQDLLADVAAALDRLGGDVDNQAGGE